MRTACRTAVVAAGVLLLLVAFTTAAYPMDHREEISTRDRTVGLLGDAADHLLRLAASKREAVGEAAAAETLAAVDEICAVVRLEKSAVDAAVERHTARAKVLLDEGKVTEARSALDVIGDLKKLQTRIASVLARLVAHDLSGEPGDIAESRTGAWYCLALVCYEELALAHALHADKRDSEGDLAVQIVEKLVLVMKRSAGRAEVDLAQLTALAKQYVEQGEIKAARGVLEELDALVALRSRMKSDLTRIASDRKRVRKAGPTPPPAFLVPRDRSPHWTAAFGARMDKRTLRRFGGSKSTEDAVRQGLVWLAEHQDPAGHWDCDGFMRMDRITPICDGAGNPIYDTGVTGLALLAFLGAGETHRHGGHRETVRLGLDYLRKVQDPEGCFGSRVSNHFTYCHAIATLAMVEAYALVGSVELERSAQRGVDFILKCRNPYLAWRYGERPQDNDTSASGWMLHALTMAKLSGLRVDPAAFEGMRNWLEKVTEPEYGRVGYTSRGTGPARPQDVMDQFPSDKCESLTAVGILSRIFLGEDPEKSEMIAKGVDLCTKVLPVWDEQSGDIDMYYWYYGTMAMFQVGGRAWEHWNQAMKAAVFDNRRKDGAFKGSWDPLGPWGVEGGRVYSTALCVLMLEAPYRYGRIFERAK